MRKDASTRRSTTDLIGPFAFAIIAIPWTLLAMIGGDGILFIGGSRATGIETMRFTGLDGWLLAATYIGVPLVVLGDAIAARQTPKKKKRIRRAVILLGLISVIAIIIFITRLFIKVVFH